MSESIVHNLEVIVTIPEDRCALLTEAEAVLRSAAEAQKLEGSDPQNLRGILVTRHDASRYTLHLDETVPYGETQEKMLYGT
jgi:hypothetical protein